MCFFFDTTEMEAGGEAKQGWTIHINVVNKAIGARLGLQVASKVSFILERGAEATVQDLVTEMKNSEDMTIKTTTALDLKPLDESKLGQDTTHYGRGYKAGTPANWVPDFPDPRPINCSWTPSMDNPEQKLSEAGLCDGAELSLVKVRCWKG